MHRSLPRQISYLFSPITPLDIRTHDAALDCREAIAGYRLRILCNIVQYVLGSFGYSPFLLGNCASFSFYRRCPTGIPNGDSA
jgi:hypothetical protein